MGNIDQQEDNGQKKRENKIVFFLKSNRFICLISFFIALAISCILIFVVASRYIIVTAIAGIVIISSMTITLSFMVFILIWAFTRKK